jgi:hypothetical protein
MIRHYERFNSWFSTFLFLSSLHYCGEWILLKLSLILPSNRKDPTQN